MADLLVLCLGTRPAVVWLLSLLHLLVGTCTAWTLRSGSCTQNLLHHLQQAGGQGEEERLQPGEEGARREDGREERKKLHSHPEIVFSPTWTSLPLAVLLCKYIFNIWLTFYQHHIYVYVRGGTKKRSYAFLKKTIHYLW